MIKEGQLRILPDVVCRLTLGCSIAELLCSFDEICRNHSRRRRHEDSPVVESRCFHEGSGDRAVGQVPWYGLTQEVASDSHASNRLELSERHRSGSGNDFVSHGCTNWNLSWNVEVAEPSQAG